MCIRVCVCACLDPYTGCRLCQTQRREFPRQPLVSRFGVREERGCWVLLWNASKQSEKPKETKSNPIYEAPHIKVNPIESAVKWWNHSSESKIRLQFIQLWDISHTLDTADRHCMRGIQTQLPKQWSTLLNQSIIIKHTVRFKSLSALGKMCLI